MSTEIEGGENGDESDVSSVVFGEGGEEILIDRGSSERRSRIKHVLKKSPTALEMYEKTCESLDLMPRETISDFFKSGVERLEIDGLLIGDSGFLAVCVGLKVEPTIKELNIANNRLTDRSIAYLIEIIRAGIVLDALDLSDNREIGDNGIYVLLQVLAEFCPLLESLNISNTGIVEMSKKIVHLSTNSFTNLRRLVIGRNRLEKSAIDLLADRLTLQTSSIVELELSSCGLNFEEGLKKLIKNVEKMPNLAELSLEANCLEDDGIELLAKSLAKNKSIRNLNVAACSITTNGMILFADIIEKNTTLQRLDFSFNPFGTLGANVLILAAAADDSSLQHLELRGQTVNNFFILIMERIKSCLNRTLTANFQRLENNVSQAFRFHPVSVFIDDFEITRLDKPVFEHLFMLWPMRMLIKYAEEVNFDIYQAFKLCDRDDNGTIFVEDTKKLLEGLELSMTESMRSALRDYIRINSKDGVFDYNWIIVRPEIGRPIQIPKGVKFEDSSDKE